MLPSTSRNSNSHGPPIGVNSPLGRQAGYGLAGAARRVAGSSSAASLIHLFEPRFGGGVVDTVGGATTTLQGNATSSSLLKGRPAVTLDGTGDYISTSGTTNVFVNGRTTSFVLLAQRNSSSSDDALFGGTQSPGAYLRLESGSTDVGWRFNSSGGGPQWTAAWPGNSQPVCVGFVAAEAANTVTLYINGTSQGDVASAAQFVADDTLEIGRRQSGADDFAGVVGPVAVFSGALTAAEMAQIARASGL